MAIEFEESVSIDSIDHALLRSRQIRLGVLRLDRIHPLVSGNKWFKLKENMKAAQQGGFSALLSFGGTYSNHLSAMAAAAQLSGLRSIGMVRGLHGKEQPTETLRSCMETGMELHYMSREAYARKDDPSFLARLQAAYPDAYIIPEGGDNEQGMMGAGAIAAYIPSDVHLVVLAAGTGTTFAGIRRQLDPAVAMLGFPVMKGGMYLRESITQKLGAGQGNWDLNADYHFGGFAKYNDRLTGFMNDFYKQHEVPLDIVYTSKMMYGVFELLSSGHFLVGSNILCIHTGGLQGNRSVSRQLCYPAG